MGLSRRRRSAFSRGEEGQAITEYLLIISVILTAGLLVMRGMSDANVMGILMKPLQETFASAYQHGHPKAKGLDGGQTPELHPRLDDSGNFRIFLQRAE
jgi:hypothetical protein